MLGVREDSDHDHGKTLLPWTTTFYSKSIPIDN